MPKECVQEKCPGQSSGPGQHGQIGKAKAIG